MIEKLKNEEEDEVITTEIGHINEHGEEEVLETIIENTGLKRLRKPNITEIVDKINDLVDLVNLQQEQIQRLKEALCGGE